jgi:hypothetical protein
MDPVSAIETSPTDDITVCLVDEYPSKVELDAFLKQVALLDEKNADLSTAYHKSLPSFCSSFSMV